jgi:hypothetical protein
MTPYWAPSLRSSRRSRFILRRFSAARRDLSDEPGSIAVVPRPRTVPELGATRGIRRGDTGEYGERSRDVPVSAIAPSLLDNKLRRVEEAHGMGESNLGLRCPQGEMRLIAQLPSSD